MKRIIYLLTFSIFLFSCQKESIQHSDYVNLYLPNAFTPGGNSMNEIFKPVIGYNGGSITKWEFTIWNDQQQQVFFTNDLNIGWNGKLMNKGIECKMGSYTYIIKYKDNTYKDFYCEGVVLLRR